MVMVRLSWVMLSLDSFLAGKLLTRVEITDIDQHSSLLQEEICYSRKSFIVQASSFLQQIKNVDWKQVKMRMLG